MLGLKQVKKTSSYPVYNSYKQKITFSQYMHIRLRVKLNGNLIKNILLPWTTDFLVELSGLFMQRKKCWEETWWHCKTTVFKLKGTLSQGFLRFGVKNVLKFRLNAFSCKQNTPRMSREGNQMIFSKEEQTIVSFWRFFPETKEKLENISLTFLSCNHSHPSNR